MKPYTLQSAFNKSYRAMRRQKWGKCMEHGACVYFARDGKRCAIGHLMLKSDAAKLQASVTQLAHEGLLPSYLKKIDVDALQQLQYCHDSCYTDMRERFENFAEVYDLTVPK